MGDIDNIYRHKPAAGGLSSHLVVFLHGYGADGKDLIDLANPFAMALPNATFISPDAPNPCAMSPQGRQWFPIEEIPNGAIRANCSLLSPIVNISEVTGVPVVESQETGVTLIWKSPQYPIFQSTTPLVSILPGLVISILPPGRSIISQLSEP